ncbi:MAG: hypothetical protein NT085_02705 [candidate division SR1 bacterium]|nr:hypothetical protein [candidate division SR1 bacterium]
MTRKFKIITTRKFKIFISCVLLLISLTGPYLYVLTIFYSLPYGWIKSVIALSCLLSTFAIIQFSIYRLLHLSKAKYTFDKKVEIISKSLFGLKNPKIPLSSDFKKATKSIEDLKIWISAYERYLQEQEKITDIQNPFFD